VDDAGLLAVVLSTTRKMSSVVPSAGVACLAGSSSFLPLNQQCTASRPLESLNAERRRVVEL
jgi:hypothetical protein